ncbi:heavy metal-binding domain-containing protein [Clostridium sp. D33t1_170424_F3]|uniref:heavy metal-binding domain-containing protein n=1 Tax=Clostridium sp. D33t1_170424_F3 TaxID=2787099 RepID=UPI0018A8BABD|nr:heavy metal-binding domain-containing protein [Clostridium sp. D33t1_170424_F3]
MTEVLFTDEEIQGLSSEDLWRSAKTVSEKYKVHNPLYNKDLWRIREEREFEKRKQQIKKDLEERTEKFYIDNMMTTGYSFDGYKIVSYNGVIFGEVVLGTGFLSEFGASLSDFFGIESNMFADKLKKAKQAAIKKLAGEAIRTRSNAIIGIDIDYITFSNNMMGVVANGTGVTIEKIE